MPILVKKDGRREPWDRQKLVVRLEKACEKRPVSINAIEEFIENLERDLRETGEKEIASYKIGEKIMTGLHEIDDVAYVRFASVYREFKDVNDFVDELKSLLTVNNKTNH